LIIRQAIEMGMRPPVGLRTIPIAFVARTVDIEAAYYLQERMESDRILRNNLDWVRMLSSVRAEQLFYEEWSR
jgi:hypothetical protein